VRLLGGAPDVVLSDMAPNTVGHRETDHLRIMGLIEQAAVFAEQVLRPGGAFVTKSFQGGGSGEMIASLKPKYQSVRNVKPPASRSDSSEVYLVALGLKR
jgi:23S rRNA (uridine2552-2'-O)-methyltransferase